jgi:hypothetical protein
MPTPDASAFTRQSKLRAFQGQVRDNNVKVLSHLYQPIIPTSGLVDFLPSFSNKISGYYTLSLPWSKKGPNLTANQTGGQGPNITYIARPGGYKF